MMWNEPLIVEVLAMSGLKQDQSDLGDALHAIFHELDMPRSLKAVGVTPDKFEDIAINSQKDSCHCCGNLRSWKSCRCVLRDSPLLAK